jgi:CDP-glucose 4,6-dehydratase
VVVGERAVEDLVNREFWREKRVFLTGHTGFKGSWVSLWLQRLGAELTGYALNPPTTPSLFSAAHVGDSMRSIIGDVRDKEMLASAMRQARPDVVLHMAAQPLVRYSYHNPVETYATNVMGTVHVLEAVRQTETVRAVVNITSDKCYENREWSWGYRENDPMGGYDPYSSSKGCAELLTAAYRNSYFNAHDYAKHGVALASARAGNVIGGGDWAVDRLIPDIVRAIEAGQSVNIRNPDAIRPWQHVLEPLCGYLMLAEKLCIDGPSYADAWNFGPDDSDAQPVKWIAASLTSAWGDKASWHVDSSPHPHEAHYLKLDCSKARSKLGWRPRMPLADALQSIVDWHKAFCSSVDMKAFTLQQISNYETAQT